MKRSIICIKTVCITTILLNAVFGVFSVTQGFAQNAESDIFLESILSNRSPTSDQVVSGSVQPRKRYPGGADEDDLQVQPVLPNPSRGLEAHNAAVSEAAASAVSGTDASD